MTGQPTSRPGLGLAKLGQVQWEILEDLAVADVMGTEMSRGDWAESLPIEQMSYLYHCLGSLRDRGLVSSARHLGYTTYHLTGTGRRLLRRHWGLDGDG